MEQHPVPQNVTTFQFRLIGDMTIKQFGYLAGGAIIGYICYKLPLPFFFTWPLTVFSVLLGIGLASVPIEERPMDVWLLSFIESIYSPTQYLWSRQKEQKTTPQQPPPPQPSTVSAVRTTMLSQVKQNDPSDFLKRLFTAKPTPPKVTAAPQANPQPMPTPVNEPEKPATEKELIDKVKKLEAEVAIKTAIDRRILELQQQLTDVMTQKNKMEQDLVFMRQRLTRATQMPQAPRPIGFPTTPPPTFSRPTTSTQPSVRVIPPESAVRAGLPRLTTFPNIITGIIKDAEGNLLTGILVTVRDKNDVPVRALKTNKLGQFAASTQLSDDTYTVDIEDPQGAHFFDRIKVTLNGTVLPPVEVVSKSKKQMERSELAKSIFGGDQV